MRRSSLFMLVGAVLLGLIAVFIARGFLTPTAPQQVAAAPVTEPVVVAAAPLAFGDRVTADKLKVVGFPPAAIPQGAYHIISAVVADGQRVALRPLALNEIVTPLAVSGAGNRLSMMGVIGPSMRAVSVTVSEPTGVGGLVVPGDHVDVFVTRTPPEHSAESSVALSRGAVASLGNATKSALANAGAAAAILPGVPPRSEATLTSTSKVDEKPAPITDLLVQNVRVLAIGQNMNVGSDKPEIVKSATLEVTPEQVSKLTLGGQVGTLTFALRALAAQDRAALPSLRVQDLHDGPPRYLAVAHAARARVAPHVVEGPSIEIVRGGAKGSESQKYSVPGE